MLNNPTYDQMLRHNACGACALFYADECPKRCKIRNQIGCSAYQQRETSVSHYRALNLDGDAAKGVSTQGTFSGVEDIKKRLIERGLDCGEVLRVEREHDGKWLFVQNIVIPT